MKSGVITPNTVSQFTKFWVLVWLLGDSCQQPKHVAVDWCHVYVLVCARLMKINKLVNFNCSHNMNTFKYCMIINLASLNIYIYIIFVISFHILTSQLVMVVFFSRSPPSPRMNTHSVGPTYWHLWTHRFYIDANTGGVMIIPYYFSSQPSFIKRETIGSPANSRCLVTKLHGVRPSIQQSWHKSHGIAPQCLCVIRSYKSRNFFLTTAWKEFF